MSTIVVVKKAGEAVIAADTLTTFGNTKFTHSYYTNKDKILNFKDNYIGITGSSAHHNVFQSIIRKHSELLSFKSIDDIFDTYVKLHPVLKEKYYLNTNEGKGDEQDYESSQINALVINPYGIFGMYAWREVYEHDKFWSIGSGRDYALGAMYGIYDLLDSAEEIAKIGVTAGCEFDDASSLPCTIYKVNLYKSKESAKEQIKGRRRR